MERAQRALIMAAGFGQRMLPVTRKVPKPLVAVRGVRFIDNQIEALHRIGITDIVVVIGHLKEQFYGLPDQYPGVRLVENPDYDQGNNITSMYYARAYLDRPLLVLDGDILINDLSAIDPEFSRTTYGCTWYENIPIEWVFDHDDDWRITKVHQNGGTGWTLRSISLWTKADALRLRDQITEAYEVQGLRSAYWDQVALDLHFGEYEIGIRRLRDADILEIDTFEELCQADPFYIGKEDSYYE